jgi:hypothetical protein
MGASASGTEAAAWMIGPATLAAGEAAAGEGWSAGG